jgi:hypothetical protein
VQESLNATQHVPPLQLCGPKEALQQSASLVHVPPGSMQQTTSQVAGGKSQQSSARVQNSLNAMQHVPEMHLPVAHGDESGSSAGMQPATVQYSWTQSASASSWFGQVTRFWHTPL